MYVCICMNKYRVKYESDVKYIFTESDSLHLGTTKAMTFFDGRRKTVILVSDTIAAGVRHQITPSINKHSTSDKRSDARVTRKRYFRHFQNVYTSIDNTSKINGVSDNKCRCNFKNHIDMKVIVLFKSCRLAG